MPQVLISHDASRDLASVDKVEHVVQQGTSQLTGLKERSALRAPTREAPPRGAVIGAGSWETPVKPFLSSA